MPLGIGQLPMLSRLLTISFSQRVLCSDGLTSKNPLPKFAGQDIHSTFDPVSNTYKYIFKYKLYWSFRSHHNLKRLI